MESGATGTTARKLARCALVVALLVLGAEAFMPRPSKQAAQPHHHLAAGQQQQPSTAGAAAAKALLGGSKQRGRRAATPTTRLGSTPMVDGPSDVEVDSSAPSDKSDDSLTDAAAAATDAAAPTPATPSTGGGNVKDELMELIAGGLLTFASPSKRAAVNELLLKLEALNPTQQPAYSPLLNGAWEFLYTGGISPGILGLQLASRLSSVASGAVEVGDTVLTISRAQPRVEVQTSLRVFGRDNNIKIRTRLEPTSDLRLDETYVEASTGSLRVPFPDQELFTRPLFVSYLDDDLLVVRDMFGAPDVLIRKDKAFLSNYTPSATDDDLAPGAG